jgi:hypothetical protein
MVWLRMGLLDDAIREHLELKRRRGAEPGEIARVEREALEPTGEEAPAMFDGEGEGPTEDDASASERYVLEQHDPAGPADEVFAMDLSEAAPEVDAGLEVDAGREALEEEVGPEAPALDVDPEAPAVDLSPEPSETGYDVDLSSVGQETAELDMQTVLYEDADVTATPPVVPPGAKLADEASVLYSHQEEPLDWEVETRPVDVRSLEGHRDAPGAEHTREMTVGEWGSGRLSEGSAAAAGRDNTGEARDEAHHERLSFEEGRF